MNKQKFITFQRSIDEELLEEAFAPKSATSSVFLRRVLPLAACLCIVIAAGLVFAQPARRKSTSESYSLAAPAMAESASVTAAGNSPEAPAAFRMEMEEAAPAAAFDEASAPAVAMVNPMSVLSREEWEALAFPVCLPDSAADVFCYSLTLPEANPVYAIRFYIGTAEYEFRMQKASEDIMEDISGVYFTSPEVLETDVAGLAAEVAVENGTGRLLWQDASAGSVFSLYISDNASPELLLETAQLLLSEAGESDN